MTETPGTETPPTPATRPYNGWQASSDSREQDQLFNERAAAREDWEDATYGWALFACIALILAGGFQVINGFVAFFRSGIYQVGRSGLALNVDYTAWGWIHLVLGVLALAAGFGLARGAMWARILGVGLSLVSAIAYMAFIPAFPVLSLVVIALDILIIFAITVHGGEPKHSRH